MVMLASCVGGAVFFWLMGYTYGWGAGRVDYMKKHPMRLKNPECPCMLCRLPSEDASPKDAPKA